MPDNPAGKDEVERWDILMKDIRRAAKAAKVPLTERDLPDFLNWPVARDMHNRLWAKVYGRGKKVGDKEIKQIIDKLKANVEEEHDACHLYHSLADDLKKNDKKYLAAKMAIIAEEECAHKVMFEEMIKELSGGGEKIKYHTVKDPGKTVFHPGDVISSKTLESENERVRKLGEREASYE